MDFVPPPNEQSQPYRSGYLSFHSLRLFSLCVTLQCGSHQPPFAFAYTVPKIQFLYSQKWNCRVFFVSNSYLHESVSDLYIPRSVCLFGWSKIGRPIMEIYKLLTDTWMWKLGDRTFYFCFGNNETTQFHFWEFISRNGHLYWILTGPSFAVKSNSKG